MSVFELPRMVREGLAAASSLTSDELLFVLDDAADRGDHAVYRAALAECRRRSLLLDEETAAWEAAHADGEEGTAA